MHIVRHAQTWYIVGPVPALAACRGGCNRAGCLCPACACSLVLCAGSRPARPAPASVPPSTALVTHVPTTPTPTPTPTDAVWAAQDIQHRTHDSCPHHHHTHPPHPRGDAAAAVWCCAGHPAVQSVPGRGLAVRAGRRHMGGEYRTWGPGSRARGVCVVGGWGGQGAGCGWWGGVGGKLAARQYSWQYSLACTRPKRDPREQCTSTCVMMSWDALQSAYRPCVHGGRGARRGRGPRMGHGS